MESRQLALRGEGAQQRGRGRRERNDEATAAEVEGEEAENSATFAAIALARAGSLGLGTGGRSQLVRLAWLWARAAEMPMGLSVAICHLGSSYWATHRPSPDMSGIAVLVRSRLHVIMFPYAALEFSPLYPYAQIHPQLSNECFFYIKTIA